MRGILPPFFVKGTKAQATQFWITMPTVTLKPHYWAARAAQERVEFWLRWIFTLALSAPLVLIAYHFAAEAFWFVAVVIVLLVSRVVVGLKPVLRQLEYIGHATEVIWAARLYGADLETYLAEEARRMHEGYSGLFAAYSVSTLMHMLRKRFGLARMLSAPLSWQIGRDFKFSEAA